MPQELNGNVGGMASSASSSIRLSPKSDSCLHDREGLGLTSVANETVRPQHSSKPPEPLPPKHTLMVKPRASLELLFNKMFAGFKSQCTTPSLCRCAIADAACMRRASRCMSKSDGDPQIYADCCCNVGHWKCWLDKRSADVLLTSNSVRSKVTMSSSLFGTSGSSTESCLPALPWPTSCC